MLTYAQRIPLCINSTARELLALMEQKKTNLALSADVTSKAELLRLADSLGPKICILKTHIDIINDFDAELVQRLQGLAKLHQFMIFEDRKFADIGNTVQLQYGQGIYRIADWAKITNAHTVPGAGIIAGLKKVGLPKGNALLLLAEMSSKGNLMNEDYRHQTVAMAEANLDFVMGFITQRRLSEQEGLINMTPGVQLNAGGDALGQQYITPEDAIITRQSDVIIVGRGIYEAADPLSVAEEYRRRGWEAYQRRV